MNKPARHTLFVTPPRASSFIVTLYGDVVEPRGGVLWMGTLIACCARQGISESLVRTAVSRLVAAGRLQGERIGRRSFYRLSAAAQDEFRRAGRILFSPPDLPTAWVVALSAPPQPGWAALGDGAIAPDSPRLVLPPGPVLRARSIAGVSDLPEFAARHWPLADVARIYRAFLARFSGLASGIETAGLEDAEALALRLRLTDEYRHAALADPRLPAEAMPADWPAGAAHDLFRHLYVKLSPAADRWVGASFADSVGLLPESTQESRRRVEDLARRERKELI
ncbi:PaaX family transcriptional regulator C-terminal domain-containing protein [Paracoccus stylophorae]|uniref:PaaX family transcriptional regulator C-terminal domain-containing protein n=1 Tax=Paracoccus stylophorae TaxID=659350 RepID=UPI0023505DBE|nr:PaaX family transcriptional regulator C-terminal domain-containing protein [Paracoccus stylophorae]